MHNLDQKVCNPEVKAIRVLMVMLAELIRL